MQHAVPDGSRVLNINSKLRQSDEVVIAFEDCGPGIDPKIMHRIFDPFFTTKPQGMGMGVVHMPLDYRSAQRAALGFLEQRSWIGV
jgi:nitrogen fixation/metabolism regulation signal transduction histidine kinase